MGPSLKPSASGEPWAAAAAATLQDGTGEPTQGRQTDSMLTSWLQWHEVSAAAEQRAFTTRLGCTSSDRWTRSETIRGFQVEKEISWAEDLAPVCKISFFDLFRCHGHSFGLKNKKTKQHFKNLTLLEGFYINPSVTENKDHCRVSMRHSYLLYFKTPLFSSHRLLCFHTVKGIMCLVSLLYMRQFFTDWNYLLHFT